jgi:hypothetical protein
MEGLIMPKNKAGTIVEISFQRLRRLRAIEADRAANGGGDAVQPISGGRRHAADARNVRREIFEAERADNVLTMTHHRWDCDTAHRLDHAADELRRSDEALRDAYRLGDRESIDAARASLQAAIARYLQADAARYAAP